MLTRSSEVIVIGGGVNGLAAATRLAREGARVTLLETAAQTGGAMAARGAAGDMPLAHLTPGLDPRVAKGMALETRGLRFHAPLRDTALDLGGDHRTVAGGLASGADAAAWATLHQRLMRFASVLAPFRAMAPPRLKGGGNDWGALMRHGLGLRAIGAREFRELLRMVLINAADVAEDELNDPLLQGLMAHDATQGAWLGPRSPNSLILYLNRLAMGAQMRLPVGGMGSVAKAMTEAATAAGVTIRLGARVAQIETLEGRVTGVVLDDGARLLADHVVSAISPKATFLDLIGPRGLETGLLRATRDIRARGATARLTLRLNAAPNFRGADLQSRMVIAPSVNAVEEAWNPVKYGEVPKRPVMEIVIPTATEPELAPDGGHVLSALVQCAPHDPAKPKAAKTAMLKATMRVLEDYAPGLGEMVSATHFLMPWEIEAEYGLSNWHHAELSVEQMLFNRPNHATAQYATPIAGLWLGSAGSHPGGGITGAAGWNAAGAIIRGKAV